MQESTDHLTHDGPVRTDLHCTNCGKNFIAELDFSLDGNHEIHCPWCHHIHYRRIISGKVTSDRYHSDNTPDRDHQPIRIWKSGVLPITTSMASAFIRDRWLEKLT